VCRYLALYPSHHEVMTGSRATSIALANLIARFEAMKVGLYAPHFEERLAGSRMS
jgi:hypothetical protein